jgi:hypothetical protein
LAVLSVAAHCAIFLLPLCVPRKPIPWSCVWRASGGIVGGVKNKHSWVADAFWFFGGINGLITIIALGLLIFAGAVEAGVWIVAGLSGMLGCFAVAAIVQALCNIDHRLDLNNQRLGQLLRAYGHEPEA